MNPLTKILNTATRPSLSGEPLAKTLPTRDEHQPVAIEEMPEPIKVLGVQYKAMS